ncbi:hypothetical protein D3C76_1067860 [compost metagenome]
MVALKHLIQAHAHILQIQFANRHRFTGQDRGQDHVVILHEHCQLPAQRMNPFHRRDILGAADVALVTQDDPGPHLQFFRLHGEPTHLAQQVDIATGACTNNAEHVVEKLQQPHRQAHRFDTVPQGLAQPRGLAHRLKALG